MSKASRLSLKMARSPSARWSSEQRSLARSFDPTHNALNFLRLVLATLVIVGHSFPLGGYDYLIPERAFFPRVAVDGFFAISGFLIARSWARGSGWTRFLWHRTLRIVPAFWVCLVVMAFAIIPLATWLNLGSLSGYWSEPNGPFSFIRDQLLMWTMGNGDVAAGLAGLPNQNWNGSLWTIYWELLCYLGLGAACSMFVTRNKRAWVLVLFSLLWAGVALRAVVADLGVPFYQTVTAEAFVRLPFMFLAGTVLYLYAERIPISGILALLAASVLALSLWYVPDYRALGGPALAYLLLWLGVKLPIRVGMRTDISYGMYLYAFPVQQLLVILGANELGLPVYAALGVACTVPFALASWFAVERPALRLKSRIPAVIISVPAERRSRSRAVGAAVLTVLFAAYLALGLAHWPPR